MAERKSNNRRSSSSPSQGRFGHWMREPEKAKNVRGTLLRIWDYLKHQGWALAGTTLLVAISSITGLLGPFLMGKAVDDNILKGDTQGLLRTALLMLGVYIVTSSVSWLQTYVMSAASQQAVRDIRNELFAKLQTLSLRYFDQRTHGELMSRLSNDVENISVVITSSVTGLLSSVLGITGVSVMMLIINTRLAAVSLVTLPLMVILSRAIAKRTRKGFRQQQALLGDLNGIIEESITGQRVVKAYVREQAVVEQFDKTNLELRVASTRAQIYAGTLGPLNNSINNVSYAIIAGAGGWMAVQGTATVGAIITFVNYARRFSWPLSQLLNLYNQIQSAIAGAERVFEVLDEVPELADVPDALSLGEIKGEVVFDDVCFGYDADVPVLKHVSLHAVPGQTIALVGPTGAGKTTIVNLLTRFYDISSGQILIDDMDIRLVKKADLRRKLGIVLQDTYLFAAPVIENIRYGRLAATDEEVIAAAKLANADQFIHRLPQGYQTELSERGSNLSQGQRQLLAIARAILADPSILILDEATSSVDTRTEKNIQEAMLRLMEGRTSFVIAHRLSTIRGADKILVINEGEIIERGTHEELLDANGFYNHLYFSQFKGQHHLVSELMS